MNDFFQTDEEFYEAAQELREKLVRIAQIKLYDIYEAEDAVTEALLKACERRGQLREKEKLHNWLITILINHSNDILREKLKEFYSDKDISELPLEDTRELRAPDRLELVLDIEKILDIMLALEPEEYSEVVILYYYRKFDYTTMAEVLGVPLGTVKSRLNRARVVLREALEKNGISREDLERIKDIGRWPEIRLLR